ncbi:MAG TPA: bifunctional precorrin-2 dehydrogenase/sirohydrochlorin ferrochelatase [Vicinamibacteria bacterium]
MPPLFPISLKVEGRRVLVVGGGNVAESKTQSLLEAGALVHLVAPEIRFDIAHPNLTLIRREFEPSDLDGCWLAIAAAPAEVNRDVSAAATDRRIFVIAVDDLASATAYGVAVVRRAGVTLGISTDGAAPALSGLIREGLERVLPDDLDAWSDLARTTRSTWREQRVPMSERRPLLLRALNQLYGERSE